MNVFLGTSASSGIGIGKAFVVPKQEKRIIPRRKILENERQIQWENFEKSLANVVVDISQKLDASKNDKIQSQLYETYFLMLNDPEFLKELKNAFYSHSLNIEFVLDRQTEKYANKLRSSGNEYLAERAQDICDIFGKVLDDLLDFHPFDMDSIPDSCVIVATQINPSDTLILSKRKIAGLALTEGGVSSHVGILARNYGIPAVFALEEITSQIKTGETVVVDGDSGEVISNPDEVALAQFNKKIEEEKINRLLLEKFRNVKAATKDGENFNIFANIGTVEEAQQAVQEGADGIGLFRTEFLFMSESNAGRSNLFDEESQFIAYKKVLETMGKKPVTIRTLDAGGDKFINSSEIQFKEEKNPLMGLRAIRLSLANPLQLKIQFRALYRASVFGNLKIMLPLITNVTQVEQTLEIAKTAREELKTEGIEFKNDVPIGIMIETAAAALTADCLAKVSDFFSIGTNDLTQYTIGVDRENASVAPLYDEFHLAVLRMIENTISEGEKAKIDVSVCGEMASRKSSVLVLAGMGVRNFSMSPKMICPVKELLSRYSVKELQNISSKQLNSL
ncbi:phosphoenolpyruvate--protein phosphotransferase [Treponema pectinovorum]|uniref:phosphoenolpyruvate--protein phosphotransferase n=1 Tax=Treponema pectinovorum TaxID=164 RepID=UPI0011F181EF|nr:phosphoenolpyruvate--protein phosphotransferase [Treponema pectinovorum]